MVSTKAIGWLMIGLILGFFMMGSTVSMVEQSVISVESGIVRINPTGAAGSALVVYHPGVTTFNRDVTYAFAGGLAETGWRCDVTTASPVAPTDLAVFDLLVLVTPTYFNEPARSIAEYVGFLGDLGGLPVELVVTAGTDSRVSSMQLEALIHDANGSVLSILELWQSAPNEAFDGVTDPIEIARRAGSSIDLP